MGEQTKEETDTEKTKIKNTSVKAIAIDPGHQTKGNSSKEPIGPRATETKAKVTTGAKNRGITSYII